MRPTPYLRTALVMLAILSMAAAQNPQTREVSLYVGSAIVADLKGDIALRTPQGAPLTAQRGLTLEAESVVETGKGSLLLNLQDGSQVLVKPHSRVLLKSPTRGKGYYLEVLLGKVLAQVQKRFGNSPSFRIGTPTAVITVRGTRFSVEVTKKNKTVVDVYEGVVAVAGFGSEDRPVLLAPGFWTEVSGIGRAPSEPREGMNLAMRTDRESQGGSDDGYPSIGAWGGQRTSTSGQGESSGSTGSETERETTTSKPTRPPGTP